MDPLRLVGMTQGARKRAAWRRAVEKCGGLEDLDLVRDWYEDYAPEYRIGERLRPCRGCPKCTEWAEEFDSRCTDTDKVWYLHDPDSSHPCDWSCGREMRGVYCDGSGVLPARARRQCTSQSSERKAQRGSRLFGALRLVDLGQAREVTPAYPEEGRYRVVVEARTPLIVRHGSHERKTRTEHREMSGTLLIGGVYATLKKCLPADQAAGFEGMRLFAKRLAWEYIAFGTGWNSDVQGGLLYTAEVDADARGLLALRIAAELGLGTYVSRGFGRVRLAEVRRLDG